MAKGVIKAFVGVHQQKTFAAKSPSPSEREKGHPAEHQCLEELCQGLSADSRKMGTVHLTYVVDDDQVREGASSRTAPTSRLPSNSEH